MAAGATPPSSAAASPHAPMLSAHLYEGGGVRRCDGAEANGDGAGPAQGPAIGPDPLRNEPRIVLIWVQPLERLALRPCDRSLRGHLSTSMPLCPLSGSPLELRSGSGTCLMPQAG